MILPSPRSAKKVPYPFVIPSEARNLSFFSWAHTEERFLASLGMTKKDFISGNLGVISA